MWLADDGWRAMMRRMADASRPIFATLAGMGTVLKVLVGGLGLGIVSGALWGMIGFSIVIGMRDNSAGEALGFFQMILIPVGVLIGVIAGVVALLAHTPPNIWLRLLIALAVSAAIALLVNGLFSVN